MVVKLFVKSSCNSSRKARDYFSTNEIPHNFYRLHKEGITEADLKQILSLTEDGVEEIIRTAVSKEYEDKSLKEFISAAVENPHEMLKTPIMLDEGKLLVGFNEEDIRLFIPRERKKQGALELLRRAQ